PGLRLGEYTSDDLVLKKLLNTASRVSGRPTPPNSVVARILASRYRVVFAVSFSPWIRGRAGNSFPDSLPKKKSPFIGPSQPRIQGRLRDSIGRALHIYMGSALSLKISAPPTPRPHQRLCFPTEKSQPATVAEI